MIKENYKNTLEYELKALNNEFLKKKNKNIYSSSVFRKKLLKVNPLVNYSLDIGVIGVSEESKENKIYD